MTEISNINNNSELSHSVNKYAVLLEYDGTNFAGSQFQPGFRTVQDELNKALMVILRAPTKITMAGRTDTGVSALGQVAHFETTEELNSSKIAYSLNAVLPQDISIRTIEQVDMNFHSRKSARKRWYRFYIYNHPYRSALNYKCLHVYHKLDENLINQALQALVGTHYFDSFKSSNSDTPYSNCTVYKASCFRERDFIYIDLVANRYLFNMVRIIVGTVLEIGKNEKPVNHLAKVLEARDRKKAGITVKPDGLTLMDIEYPEEFNLFSKENTFKISHIMLENFMEAKNEDLLRKAS